MAPDLSEDLLVRGEAVRLVLRVDPLAVERDVEHAAVTALEASGDSELLLDRGLQTGGLGVVVSFGAVGDLDVHPSPPFHPGAPGVYWMRTVPMIADLFRSRPPIVPVGGGRAARERAGES
jgi:hypothetical protein